MRPASLRRRDCSSRFLHRDCGIVTRAGTNGGKRPSAGRSSCSSASESTNAPFTRCWPLLSWPNKARPPAGALFWRSFECADSFTFKRPFFHSRRLLPRPVKRGVARTAGALVTLNCEEPGACALVLPLPRKPPARMSPMPPPGAVNIAGFECGARSLRLRTVCR
jgi:hypothetical protein